MGEKFKFFKLIRGALVNIIQLFALVKQKISNQNHHPISRGYKCSLNKFMFFYKFLLWVCSCKLRIIKSRFIKWDLALSRKILTSVPIISITYLCLEITIFLEWENFEGTTQYLFPCCVQSYTFCLRLCIRATNRNTLDERNRFNQSYFAQR